MGGGGSRQVEEERVIAKPMAARVAESMSTPGPVLKDITVSANQVTEQQTEATAAAKKSLSQSNKATEVVLPDGRREKTYPDGRREINFLNGLKKILWGDGRASVVFPNGDRKECLADGTVVYHYEATKATQTTFPHGLELFKFATGQVEKHFPDGVKEITFPNGTHKTIFTDGSEEMKYIDGTTVRKAADRVKQKNVTAPGGMPVAAVM